MSHIDDRPERAEMDWIFNPSAPHTEEDLLDFSRDAAATLGDEETSIEEFSNRQGAKHV
ncbi:MAG: hypothetical protein ACQKBY_10030 [Verrucomicrobiales bacterium]